MATWASSVRTRIRTFVDRDRANIRALAAHLGVGEADAAWIYTRSREVGFPTALADFERWCLERSARTAD